jgi:hypothetical protein
MRVLTVCTAGGGGGTLYAATLAQPRVDGARHLR